MKCPHYDIARSKKMERNSAADLLAPKVLHLNSSPVKEPIKPPYLPVEVMTISLNTSAVHDKENSASKHHDKTLNESGYVSLHSSEIENHVDEEDDHIQGRPATLLSFSDTSTHHYKTPQSSPMRDVGTSLSHSMCLVAASTPVGCPTQRSRTSVSSVPSEDQDDPRLPILKFQRAVCDELAKSYQKSKRYDWSIVTKVAESHLLDRVIGSQMGLEYVDMFSSLRSRNMKSILTNILALLGDMDLIRCKKVSRTWKSIICDDTAALRRCQRAEQALQESRSSLKQRGCGLTRDVGVSRVVLSCMQTRASTSTPSSSSSTTACGVNRQAAVSQKGSKADSKCTRFSDYVQAATSLKQHESLRSCKRCGSPATHAAEVQRATCTRQSCLFDFCTRCQGAFHGSAPCRVVLPRNFSPSETNQIIPGSARSKRNIKRL